MAKEHEYCVYILSRLSGTLYVGITSELRQRMWEHKRHVFEGFTAAYEVDRLMYWESFQLVQQAIAREKQLKGWTRQKKIALFSKSNPSWKDLSREWFREEIHRVKPTQFGSG